VPGLGTSFGRGGATTLPQDLVSSDAVLIMGSNMAEAHPIAFARVVEAKERGAKVIHVDPRFSRTSALADLHVAIRAGSDIAFLGGIINWVFENDRWFHEYVTAYTNAATLIDPGFKDTEDLDGVFSGFDPSAGRYDPKTWQYRRDAAGHVMTDSTLSDPNCVLNIVRRHFARYTPEMVARACGCNTDEFLAVCRTLAENSGRERTSAFCYAVGWTQHSHGVQNIRAAAILQLLLGNIGRPGGGIMALRGHASIQGSTDIPTLSDLVSGYMAQPNADACHETLAAYLRTETPPSGWWSNLPKYFISLLRAWYGDRAMRDNDWAYDFLPRFDGDHTHLASTFAMVDGKIRGMLLMGQNPAAGSAHGRLQRHALAQLDWLVVRDFFETESAAFWYASPDGVDPAAIKTEIFFLPAASHLEKEGSFTNTQRLVQWREKVLDPPGDARSDAWFVHQLAKRLKEMYRGSRRKRDRPIQSLTWDYDADAERTMPADSQAPPEPDMLKVLREINGYETASGKHVASFADLKDDGSTACGSWIYSGVYPEPGRNLAASRNGEGRVFPGWGWAWPANRRILYNRASADPSGRPWSEAKRYVWWDEDERRWSGYDVPDFPSTKNPDEPPHGTAGMDALSGADPFIMMPDGKGWLFAPSGLKDGPLPAHYEPFESPASNALYSTQSNPTAHAYSDRADNPLAGIENPRFPIVMTTYRLTEHHVSGAMSRWLPWLAELQPAAFVEMSRELAREKGVHNGDWVTVTSLRGRYEGRALVTARIKPLKMEGRTVHQIGVPMHWSYMGVTTGDAPNDLTHLVLEPNVSIFEVKAIACDLRAGRKQASE